MIKMPSPTPKQRAFFVCFVLLFDKIMLMRQVFWRKIWESEIFQLQNAKKKKKKSIDFMTKLQNVWVIKLSLGLPVKHL